ncbi:DUF7408 domain-containing protein [Paenisporosarcina cavernae]|uniref:DUF7408 domain-containing protein n=1 Tax=Paenisporosarcina cavernae TaxID=2320858 RepID=A0A385YRR7_9BACL|nr:hypothetical protein [Paenisporosarcina cavernae]AYC29080.1 hypothetical protein D3873_04005 [Paenisporosarcina cavernae]
MKMIHMFKGMIAALLILFLLPANAVFAAPKLSVQAEAGFQNATKYNSGVPLVVTVKNDGDAFTGDFVIDAPEGYGIGSAKAVPFSIGANETKTIQVSLGGLNGDYGYNGTQNQMFYFYEGGWESGDEIPYTGKKSVTPQTFGPESTFIFTLTSSADRLAALSTVKKPMSGDSKVFHLAQMKNRSLPDSASSYAMGDVMVIDEYVVADEEEAVQQAILDWVHAGGVLLVGASNNVKAEVGMLGDMLPLSMTSTQKTLNKTVIEKLAKGTEFKADLPYFASTLTNGSSALLTSDTDTVIGLKQVGKGAIIQTAFSLGDEPFSKEGQAATKVYTTLLASSGLFQSNNGYMQNAKENLSYELGEMNELFPSFQLSTGVMIGLVILYILLIGPVLYILLRWKDKREHAWWIIPIVSVVISLMIFMYGAKDRLVKPQIQQLSFYEVLPDQSLSGYYVNTLLSNKSGNFTFEAEQGTSMVHSKRNSLFGGQGNNQLTSIIEDGENTDTLTLRNVGYWSVNTVLGETTIPKQGQFVTDIKVQDKKVTGTIKNEFPFNLYDVSVWSGAKLWNVGDLKAGETATVDLTIKTSSLAPSSPPSYNMGYAPVKNAADLPKERLNRAINTAANYRQRDAAPSIVGYTKDAIVPVSLNNGNAEIDAINVVYQPFKPTTIFTGEVTLPANLLSVSLSPENDSVGYMNKIGTDNYEWSLMTGSYIYEVKVPTSISLPSMTWSEISIANTDINSMTLEIWNTKTEAYEEVKSGRVTIAENAGQYISTEGTLRFRIAKNGDNGNDYTRLPEVRLKGDVSK